MPFGNKPPGKIEFAEIEQLIEDEVAENRAIDYKREVGRADDDRREFLADVSSFANTIVGYMVIGINDSEGLPVEIVGLAGDLDAEIQRLENLIRDGIQPRAAGIEIAPVSSDEGVRTLVVRVPRSF